jgi:hypothetical protein
VVFGHDAGRGRDGDGNMVIQEEDFATGLDTRWVGRTMREGGRGGSGKGEVWWVGLVGWGG